MLTLVACGSDRPRPPIDYSAQVEISTKLPTVVDATFAAGVDAQGLFHTSYADLDAMSGAKNRLLLTTDAGEVISLEVSPSRCGGNCDGGPFAFAITDLVSEYDDATVSTPRQRWPYSNNGNCVRVDGAMTGCRFTDGSDSAVAGTSPLTMESP